MIWQIFDSSMLMNHFKKIYHGSTNISLTIQLSSDRYFLMKYFTIYSSCILERKMPNQTPATGCNQPFLSNCMSWKPQFQNKVTHTRLPLLQNTIVWSQRHETGTSAAGALFGWKSGKPFCTIMTHMSSPISLQSVRLSHGTWKDTRGASRISLDVHLHLQF